MNFQPRRDNIRIAPATGFDGNAPEAPAEERPRDSRPGHFTVEGAFLDLSQALEADESETAG